MPPAKTAPFATDLVGLADALKALAHPARLAIVETLAARGTCVCGEVVDELPLAQSTVSRHLQVLKGAGLIRGEVDGPRSCYCLDLDALTRLRAATDAFFCAALDQAAPGADCC